jgi:hypothetical protein
MNVSADLHRSEALLWTILARFESLAVEQYTASAPALLTPEKLNAVALLRTRVPDDEYLICSGLEAPLVALMRSATSTRAEHVLIAQGLFLEAIGGAIYSNFRANAATSEPTRELCERGFAASARARAIVPGLLRARFGDGDSLLQAIMTEAGPLLRSIDDLGEGIDASFLEHYGVSFADLMGDVAAELIAMCIDLGIDRRKFVSFLTSALMGIS